MIKYSYIKDKCGDIMKLALAQIDIEWEDKEKNKEKLLDFFNNAKQNKVDLILFPEMTLTGFSMNVAHIGEVSENDTVKWFLKKAQEYHLHVGFGHVELHPISQKGINKFTVVSPENNILSSYSKIHPFSFGLEADFYTGGDNISTFSLKDLTICTFICYDLRFPEIFQAASKESSLITVSANWPKARREHWITLLKARAIENQCYIAGINRVGIGDNIEYSGDSMLIDPLGNIVCSNEGEETLLIQDIDITKVVELRKSFNLKNDRRENLYKEFY
jgi:predicted amidohydrolase